MFMSPNLPDRSGDLYSEVFEIDLARGLKTCRDMFNSSKTHFFCFKVSTVTCIAPLLLSVAQVLLQFLTHVMM